MSQQPTTTTLFEALGGSDAIRAVVRDFYGRVLSDANLAGFFSNTDMVHQTELQVQFLSAALGGPVEYKGRNMKEAHENLAITEFHFGLVAGHLSDALSAAGATDAQVNEIIAIAGSLKDEVCTV